MTTTQQKTNECCGTSGVEQAVCFLGDKHENHKNQVSGADIFLTQSYKPSAPAASSVAAAILRHRESLIARWSRKTNKRANKKLHKT